MRFGVKSPWFEGDTELLGYEVEELLGTKLRALYQRKKGRDLFDLDMALRRIAGVNQEEVVRCFTAYVEHGGHRVSRAQFEENLAGKMKTSAFRTEIEPLLTSDRSAGVHYDADVRRLDGKPWKVAKNSGIGGSP